MNKDIIIELMFFLISILWGAIILLAYDCLRILRRLIKHKTLLIGIEDLVFWVVASIFIFSMIYRENDGIIRGFSIMGMALGMVAYYYIFSDLIVKLVTKLIQCLLKPFGFILKRIKKIGSCFINYVLIRLKKLLKWVKIALNIRVQKKKAKRGKKKRARHERKRARVEAKKQDKEEMKAKANAKKTVVLEKIEM